MKKTDYRSELKKDYERWNQLFCEGGQDPFWPDGVNLNLVRNQILACRKSLEQEGGEMPEEYGWPLPPEVPQDYMARKKEIWYRGLESYQKYVTDENYLYLNEVSESLPKRVKKESNIENVLKSEKELRRALEQKDFVTLRRHEHPEGVLESFARCREQIGKLMTQEKVEMKGQKFTLAAEKETQGQESSLAKEMERDVGQINPFPMGMGRGR